MENINENSNVIDISDIAPRPWVGELTKSKLEEIISGRLFPSNAMSVRLARELYNIWFD